METRYHSTTAQTAYHDLLSLLLDEAVSEIRGSPTLREREGKGYWYDRYRVGTDVKERYLGEDTPALRERIERYNDLKGDAQSRRQQRSRLVRLLRSERFLGMMQAETLIGLLARDRPGDLADAYRNAIERGPRWRERIERSLKRSPEATKGIKAVT